MVGKEFETKINCDCGESYRIVFNTVTNDFEVYKI